MKKLIISVFAMAAAHTYACPNLSGEYRFEQPWNGSMTITQKGCDEISFLFKKPDAAPFTQTYKTDGSAYDGYYNYGPTEKPASLDQSPFYRAQYLADGISLKSFSGIQRKCGNTYEFGISECKMFENAIRYDARTGDYLWIQTGYIATEHNYSIDTFRMKKNR